MKTKEEMAREIATVLEKEQVITCTENREFFDEDIVAAIIAGFDACEKKMLADASEGFEEWLLDQPHGRLHMGEYNEHFRDGCRIGWQASRLSAEKIIREKDAEIKKLQEQNRKMFECLKYYAETPDECKERYGYVGSSRAKKCLKEIGETE